MKKTLYEHRKMIYLFGLSITFFLFLLILLKKDKQTPDFVLMSWIGFTAFHLFLFYLQFTGISFQYPHTLGLLLPLPPLHGVLLYFYARELTQSSVLKTRQIVLHLIPFAILVMLTIPFFSLTGEQKIDVFKQGGRGFEWYSIIQFSLILLSGFGYSLATVVTIHQHRKRVFSTFSNDDQKMLRWLEYLTIGLGIIWVVSGFFDDTIIFSFEVLFVLFIGFFGINQVPIFYSIPRAETNPPLTVNSLITPLLLVNSTASDTSLAPVKIISPMNQEKYAKTGLKEINTSQLMDRLEEIMKTEKPFKNSELTLNELAQMMNVSSHQLSQVINSRTEKTFYHYVNTYRIIEFLTMAALPGNKKYTFLALAFDCGFNSKTTFNKYFKLQTGKTPSEYFDPSPASSQ